MFEKSLVLFTNKSTWWKWQVGKRCFHCSPLHLWPLELTKWLAAANAAFCTVCQDCGGWKRSCVIAARTKVAPLKWLDVLRSCRFCLVCEWRRPVSAYKCFSLQDKYKRRVPQCCRWRNRARDVLIHLSSLDVTLLPILPLGPILTIPRGKSAERGRASPSPIRLLRSRQSCSVNSRLFRVLAWRSFPADRYCRVWSRLESI